jgi:hypothetical protein
MQNEEFGTLQTESWKTLKTRLRSQAKRFRCWLAVAFQPALARSGLAPSFVRAETSCL